MKKKNLVSMICSLVMLSGLVSCGGDNASQEPASSAAPTSEKQNSDAGQSTVPSTKPTGTVKINFWHTSGQQVVDAFTRRINEFVTLVKENEGVDVEIELTYQGGYDDLFSKVEKGFTSGTQPTLAIAYPDHVASYLADEGSNPGKYVVNMQDYIDSDTVGFGKESYLKDGAVDDFVDAFYDEGKSYAREGVYSLPIMKSSEALYYNKRIVNMFASQYNSELTSSAKIEDYMNNLTWDELISFSTFIKEHVTTETLPNFDRPFYYDSDSNLFITKCYQNNIPFISINDDGTGSLDFNNADAKAMITKLKQEYDDGIIGTKGTKGEYSSNAFTQEQCVFTVGSTGGAGYNNPTGSSFEVGVAKVPYDNNNPLYVTQGLSATILKSADDTDGYKALYAFKFLKYLTSADVNANLCVNGSEGYSPVRKSAYTTAMYSEYLEEAEELKADFMPRVAKCVYEEINGHYYTTPCFAGSSYARNEAGGIITNVLKSGVDIDKAFSDAVNNAKTHMA